MNITGERIRQARIARKMSQDELSQRVGYASRTSINKIELGKVDVPRKKLVELASALNVSPIWLLGLDKAPEPDFTSDRVTLPDEMALLNAYRSLNDEGRYILLQTANAMATSGLHSKKNNTAEAMEG